MNHTSGLKQYEPLVRSIAIKMLRNLPANIELDDLMQVGMIATHECMQRFVDDGRAKFESYAGLRISGAMIDELRRADPLSRNERKKGSTTQIVLFEDLGEDDVDFIETMAADESFDPVKQLQNRRMDTALVNAVADLSERDRNVMSMYYEHDMKLREIGVVMGLTESRICKMMRDIINELRERLSEH
jgi:RNA polymerase sigma factor for flagellar operon FliA